MVVFIYFRFTLAALRQRFEFEFLPRKIRNLKTDPAVFLRGLVGQYLAELGAELLGQHFDLPIVLIRLRSK